MAKDTKLWNAIVDTLSLDPSLDRDGAVKLADEVADALANQKAYREYLDHERRAQRKQQRKNHLAAFWTIVTALIVASGGFGIVRFDQHIHGDDYAQLDSHKVQWRAYDVIHNWYGENDLPAGMVMLSKQKVKIDDGDAWYTRWRDRNGRKVCAYVWGV